MSSSAISLEDEIIFQSEKSILYKIEHGKTLLKVMNLEYTTQQEITKFYNEFEVCEKLKSITTPEVIRMISFSLNHMPKTQGIIPAKSIYDYNSLNYMQSHSEIAPRARLLNYKRFGFPQSITNDRDRNSGDWSKIQKSKRNKFNKPVKLN